MLLLNLLNIYTLLSCRPGYTSTTAAAVYLLPPLITIILSHKTIKENANLCLTSTQTVL